MLCDSLSQHTTAESKIFTLSNCNVLSGRLREKGADSIIGSHVRSWPFSASRVIEVECNRGKKKVSSRLA